jgi:hypothetical protein
MVTEVAEAGAVPVLVRMMLFGKPAVPHDGLAELLPPPRFAPTSVIPVIWTRAEFDEDPKIPNTKPPIDTAAIRVTAIIRTVDMIGEMAFLDPESFILWSRVRPMN